MEVISLDENRVKIFDNYVSKKSNTDECDTLFKAYEMVENMDSISINDKLYNIKVPLVYSFKDNIINMEKCKGENLELILRNMETHKKGTLYVNKLLKFFLENNFYWKDFAPRNIIINDEYNEIYIMDFERGLETKIKDIKQYFIESVYEEYSAFLLPEERIYSVDEIFLENEKKIIRISEISSRRVKAILKQMGYIDIAPMNKYILAVKMIIINETPYEKENEIIYPLIELEHFMESHTHDEYAKKITEGYNGNSKKI